MIAEEKAKAYDEAKINCSRLWECGEITRENYEYMFPELAESEDERIRKELLKHCTNAVNGVTMCVSTADYARWLAWLEKQCKDFSPKVEPKFKVGDWVLFIASESAYQVEKIENYEYTLRYILGDSLCLPFYDEELIREWKIQDAKDGDVLATEDWVFIFEKMNANEKPTCYCHYDIELGFRIDTNSYIATGSEIYPATKEQRDLLFQKMKEAGYEWDAEKKELKKIEQKPDEWSEEDGKIKNELIESVECSSVSSVHQLRLIGWLKSLKYRLK